MKKVLEIAAIGWMLFCLSDGVHAQNLVWDLPLGVGTVQLPFQENDLVGGYDVLLKVPVTGYSTTVMTFWDEIYGNVGAVAALGEANPVQPYLAAGIDIKKHIPLLEQFTRLDLNAFARWDTSVGKPGAGVSASYSF